MILEIRAPKKQLLLVEIRAPTKQLVAPKKQLLLVEIRAPTKQLVAGANSSRRDEAATGLRCRCGV